MYSGILAYLFNFASKITRELECILKKIEKKWLFSVIEVVEVLKK